MFNNNNGYSLSDIAAATGNRNGNDDGFGFGNGGAWIWVLFIIFLIGGWGNNNGWGNNGGGGNTATYVTNDVQRGFDQASIMGALGDISTGQVNGFSNVQQALCGGFAGVTGAVTNGFAQAEIANNARQMADMQQNFASQTALTQNMTALQAQLAQCCCDNRAATNDLKYTIATEACADRSAISDALKDVIASNTANTQAILDKLCQQEIEALKAQNQQLQMQGYLANLAASQNAQTGQLLADNAAQTATLRQALNPTPIPAFIVNNPNGCNCNTGCGCGGNGFYN